MASVTVLHGELVLQEGIVPEGEVIIDGDHIVEVNLTPTKRPTIHWQDGWIFPGLVDTHIHGIGGYDVMDGTPEALSSIDATLAQVGCTRYLATTMSHDQVTLTRVLESLHQFRERDPYSGLLGVHLEGPFIHPDRRGAQPLSVLRRPSLLELETYYRRFGSLIRRITLAPELPDADALIHFGLHSAIYPSLGHSNATFDEAISAFDLGVQHVTHLFNAMTGLNHRDPGLAGAALFRPQVVVELIADGIHLHPAIVKMVAQMKGPRRVMLVTDAMRASMMRDGRYDLGGQDIQVSHGVARTVDGHLAGSTLTLMRAVFLYQEFTGVELFEAILAASLVPARSFGYPNLGALAPGFLADVLLVDRNGSNCMTWRGGQIIFDGR